MAITSCNSGSLRAMKDVGVPSVVGVGTEDEIDYPYGILIGSDVA